MKKMKKWLAVVLALVMCLSLVACGGGNDDNAGTDDGEQTYELNFYHIFAGVGHEQEWIDKAIAEIEEQSGGRLVINCIADGTMGAKTN